MMLRVTTQANTRFQSCSLDLQGLRRGVRVWTQVSTLTVVVAQTARVDAQLKLGGAVETVEVDTSGAQLDMDTALVSQLVSQKQVEQLPLNGCNFPNLLFNGAGAVQTVGEQSQMRSGEGNAISINDPPPESNYYTLDGMVNIDKAFDTPAVILSQDVIREFKVQSVTYSTEFGFRANQVNIVSKSGTNQFHGSVFEFNRNDAFDASTHFQPIKQLLRQNQFGFVLGGPVLLPKIYDGPNKTFFLANYEGWRIKGGTSPTNTNVPDPAQLSGNFAASGLPAFRTVPGSDCQVAIAAGSSCLPVDPTTGLTFQKGVPYSVQANDKCGLLTASNQRANLVRNPNKGLTKSVNQYFNTAAFTQPIAGTFGNSGRNILREPGVSKWDIGTLKNFTILARLNLQLRLESFNTFNHVQYGVDPTSASASAGGPGIGAIDQNVNDQAVYRYNNPANNNFGTVDSARPARILQLGGKITF